MFCKRCWTCSQPIRPQLRNLWQSWWIHNGDQCQPASGAQSETGLSKVVLRARPCGPCGAVWWKIHCHSELPVNVWFGQDFRDSGPAVFKQSKYPGQESKWFPCKSCFMLCSQSGRCHRLHGLMSYCCCIYRSSLSGIVRGGSCSDSTSSYTDEPFAELALVDAAGCWHEAWIFEHFFADCWGASNSLLLFSHWQRCTVSKFHWNVLNCQGNRIINTYRLSAMFDFSYMIMYVHCTLCKLYVYCIVHIVHYVNCMYIVCIFYVLCSICLLFSSSWAIWCRRAA